MFVSQETGVRSIKFHPDGRTLFCGLDDGLKVFIYLFLLMSSLPYLEISSVDGTLINDAHKFRFIHGSPLFVMIVLIWDGQRLVTYASAKGSSWVVHTTKTL